MAYYFILVQRLYVYIIITNNLDSPPHNHDGVVKASFGFFHKLFRPSSQQNRASFAQGTAPEKVESVKLKVN